MSPGDFARKELPPTTTGLLVVVIGHLVESDPAYDGMTLYLQCLSNGKFRTVSLIVQAVKDDFEAPASIKNPDIVFEHRQRSAVFCAEKERTHIV